jgi:ABC-type Na+ transport system ATPase subunit NatA
MKRFFVLFVVMVCVGISVYAGEVCTVLDVNGKSTTDTIRVSVSDRDDATGTVKVAISSDSDKPVNAYITITVDGSAKISQKAIRIEPRMSGEKSFNVGRLKSNSKISVDISGAKCQQ